MKWGHRYTMPFQVQFDEVDLQGAVHHPQYLKYLERARCLAMADEQYPFADMIKRGFGFVVSDVQMRFKSPLLYGDKGVVHTQIFSIGAASLRVRQMIGGEAPWLTQATSVETDLVMTEFPDVDDWPQLPGCVFWADIVLVHVKLKPFKLVPFHPELLRVFGIHTVASSETPEWRSRKVRLT